ncbi:IPT/TIG domain-containing protein [Aeromicrobium alkaliterrae]|uniref:SLH domain-containing protein n=1 Tax=Aeromicrobium alkaliterrae TaxID=302168 RepID=A0ABP4VH42_9ACTN
MTKRLDGRGLLALVLAATCLVVLLVQQQSTAGDQRPVAYTPPSVSPFVDVRGPSTGNPHTFYREIAWLAQERISTGYASPAGPVFEPGAPVLREQMAAFLYRLAGEPDVVLPATSPFVDLPASHPFYKHVVWLQTTGVTTGYAEGAGRYSFRGSQPVLREQMAAFLFRFRTWEDSAAPAVASGPRPFVDVPSSHAFQREIRWLASTGVSTGYSDAAGPTFRPANPVLREQMAAFLFRYDGLADDEGPPASPLPVVTRLTSIPSSGSGPSSVAIEGSNFTGATTVTFSGVPSPAFTVDSPTAITATVPELTATQGVDVVVTTPAGASLPGLLDLPDSGGASTITSMSPTSGIYRGGTTVTLTGSDFVNVVAVMFGDVDATSFEVVSPTKIVAVAPPSPGAGRATVTVITQSTSSNGTTWRFTSNGLVFSYRLPEPPVVTAVTPARGEVTGGTVVRVTGNFLTGVVQVSFGGQPATSVTVESQYSVLATAPPASAPGSVLVTVSTIHATSRSSAAFEYVPVDPRPVITTTALPPVTALDVFDQRLTTKDGRPGRWEVTAGDLPAGVALVGDRVTGVPTRPGLYGFTTTFTDELDQTVSVDLALHVGTPSWISGRPPSTVTRVNVPLSAPQAPFTNGSSSVSDDGRWVAFSAAEDNYAIGDQPLGMLDVFLRDTLTGSTVLVSRTPLGLSGNRSSYEPTISADGRFVAFNSFATDLVPGDTNGQEDVFVYDRDAATVERISRSVGGGQSAGATGGFGTSISADGRYVVFPSSAKDLVDGPQPTTENVYRHDRLTGATELVSLPTGEPGGAFRSGLSGAIAVSPDGRHVAYGTWRTITYDTRQVLVRDMETDEVETVSLTMHGEPGSGGSGTSDLAISADGRFVVFDSTAANLVPGDTNGATDVFVRDRLNGTTSLITVSVSGHAASSGTSLSGLDVSDDGRYVAFSSAAPDLVHADAGRTSDVFVRDTVTGLTEIHSTTVPGTPGPPSSRAWLSAGGALSGDGRFVVVQMTKYLVTAPMAEAVVDLHDRGAPAP